MEKRQRLNLVRAFSIEVANPLRVQLTQLLEELRSSCRDLLVSFDHRMP